VLLLSVLATVMVNKDEYIYISDNIPELLFSNRHAHIMSPIGRERVRAKEIPCIFMLNVIRMTDPNKYMSTPLFYSTH